jgi:hypothetical protein
MAKLVWDENGKKFYETGVNKGVLYPQAVSGLYPLGIAWNGLTAVTESPSGAEPNPLYADNIKYLNLISAEEFGATVEAYTYPTEFGACDGSAEMSPGVTVNQQTRKGFGLCYRTAIGNDTVGSDYGYKLHLIYGAMAAPSEKGYASINDSPEAITFSWALTTTPVSVTGLKPTASLTIDSTMVDSAKLAALELILYGNTSIAPRLPLPDEIAAIFAAAAPSVLALSTSVPADAATAVVVSANLVLTFNNKVAEEDITVTTQAGVVVPVTKTWDAAGKVLTIHPVASLTAATSHLIIVSGVYDIYAQGLATLVRKFTTA